MKSDDAMMQGHPPDQATGHRDKLLKLNSGGFFEALDKRRLIIGVQRRPAAASTAGGGEGHISYGVRQREEG